MKTLLALLAATIWSASSAAASPETPPDFSGKFVIGYQPVYCVKAPCPPGTYTVAANQQQIASANAIEIDADTAPEIKAVFTARDYFSGIAVEGDYWLVDGKLIVRPVRALPGDWKDEPAPGPEAGTSAAPVILTIVNRTGDVVRGLYLAPVSADHWGADRLSNNLGIKQKIAIELPAGDCLYDVRIVLGDRPAEEIRRHNVCRDPVLTADRSGRIVQRVR